MGKRRPSGDGMVRKREDGRWEGRIVIGHKESGEPIFRYLSAKTQKELLKKLHQNIEEYRDVDLSENSKMPLGQWLDRWLEEYAAPSVRPSTLEGYRGYVERNIKPYLGDKPVGKVTREDAGTPEKRAEGTPLGVWIPVVRRNHPPYPRGIPPGYGRGGAGKPHRPKSHRGHHPAQEENGPQTDSQ